MKNHVLNALIYILTGLAIAVGPYTLFKVCDTSEMVMKCWWTVRAETAIGGLLVFSGILILLLRKKEITYAVNLYNVAAGIVALLIPTVLIGGCGKSIMPCRSTTFPAIYIISVIVILFSIGNVIYQSRKQKN